MLGQSKVHFNELKFLWTSHSPILTILIYSGSIIQSPSFFFFALLPTPPSSHWQPVGNVFNFRQLNDNPIRDNINSDPIDSRLFSFSVAFTSSPAVLHRITTVSYNLSDLYYFDSSAAFQLFHLLTKRKWKKWNWKQRKKTLNDEFLTTSFRFMVHFIYR